MPHSTSSTPHHIAIIMDGNRRWARAHKLQALQGHEYVANQVIKPLVQRCCEVGIPYLTLWAFSTENWQRDPQEVSGLMNLFREAFTRQARELHEQGVRLNVIGDMSKFPADIQQHVGEWLAASAGNSRITVTFALNYGGRDEIVRAVARAAAAGEAVTVETLGRFLDTGEVGSAAAVGVIADPVILKSRAGGPAHSEPAPDLIRGSMPGMSVAPISLPDPDLIIRPGGEQRLSGFLPWQAVYAELYFTDVLMPDFTPAELDKALAEYAKRARRFGK